MKPLKTPAFLLTAAVLVLSQSCQSPSTETGSTRTTDTVFTSYLKHFKTIKLPVSLNACAMNGEGLEALIDEAFIKYGDYPRMAYGQIPPNGDYFATLTLANADCFVPTLTTFKADGTIIDKKSLMIHGCGDDCGFACQTHMSIGKDLDIYFSETISTYECDSVGEAVPGSYEHYVIYKKGRMLPDGKIELSGEIKEPLQRGIFPYSGPLKSVLSEIEGCACYFSVDKERFAANDIVFAANYDSLGYVVLNNNAVKLRLVSTTRKKDELGDHDRIDIYSNTLYRVLLDLKYKDRSGDETWWFEGTMTIEDKGGKKTTKKIVGECGC